MFPSARTSMAASIITVQKIVRRNPTQTAIPALDIRGRQKFLSEIPEQLAGNQRGGQVALQHSRTLPINHCTGLFTCVRSPTSGIKLLREKHRRAKTV